MPSRRVCRVYSFGRSAKLFKLSSGSEGILCSRLGATQTTRPPLAEQRDPSRRVFIVNRCRQPMGGNTNLAPYFASSASCALESKQVGKSPH